MRVLIVEDEPVAARRLSKMLLELAPQIDICGQTVSILETLTWLQTQPVPDLLLLDIHLADGSSFELFEHHPINCPLVFTTAYDEYALQAFKVHAIDYLLKPIKREELAAAIEKAQRTRQAVVIDYPALMAAVQLPSPEKRFLIKIGQQIKMVPSSQIAYMFTDQKISFLVTFEGRRFPIDHSLEKLEDLLPANQFFRINRQFIVNLDAIEEMYAFSKSRVKLLLRPATPLDTIVSTEKSPLFKKWLGAV